MGCAWGFAMQNNGLPMVAQWVAHPAVETSYYHGVLMVAPQVAHSATEIKTACSWLRHRLRVRRRKLEQPGIGCAIAHLAVETKRHAIDSAPENTMGRCCARHSLCVGHRRRTAYVLLVASHVARSAAQTKTASYWLRCRLRVLRPKLNGMRHAIGCAIGCALSC